MSGIAVSCKRQLVTEPHLIVMVLVGRAVPFTPMNHGERAYVNEHAAQTGWIGERRGDCSTTGSGL